MNFIDSIRVCLNKFINFEGRASRSEYWFFMLFLLILAILSFLLDYMFFGIADGGTGLFGIIYYLFALIPGSSVTVRRLHDVGKSGWFYGGYLIFCFVFSIVFYGGLLVAATNAGLLALIPLSILGIVLICCTFYLLYLMIVPGDQNANLYGENPLNYIHSTSNNIFGSNQVDLLQRLHDLHQKGILTDDEYHQRKATILGSDNFSNETTDPSPAYVSPESASKSNLEKLQEIDKKIKDGTLTNAQSIVEKGKILGSIVPNNIQKKQAPSSSNAQKKVCASCNSQVMRTMAVCPKCGSNKFIGS